MEQRVIRNERCREAQIISLFVRVLKDPSPALHDIVWTYSSSLKSPFRTVCTVLPKGSVYHLCGPFWYWTQTIFSSQCSGLSDLTVQLARTLARLHVAVVLKGSLIHPDKSVIIGRLPLDIIDVRFSIVRDFSVLSMS